MIELACPICYETFGGTPSNCGFCFKIREGKQQDTLDLIPDYLVSDAVYSFEIGRYEKIAQAGPGHYPGYRRTKPEFRAKLLLDILKRSDMAEYVNIGPGFGALEAITEGTERLVLDFCFGFLEYIKERWPDVSCARALAERLPLATGSVPCLVADSVFQSIVDREAFLCEAARVIQSGGLFLFTVAYGWNYPRRPQNGFNVTKLDERRVLLRYLEELGFDTKLTYVNLADEQKFHFKEQGDYLIIEAHRE